MKILVTGVAGFIGSHVAEQLLAQDYQVVGLDNLNHYYDVTLKQARLVRIQEHANFTFIKADITDRDELPKIFKEYEFDIVINLAAQPGVRYSLESPESYIDSNLVGFGNILECCRHARVRHLLYASSSSVYGDNETLPFSEQDNVDRPMSLYAASKKANELMAHCYSHLYGMPCIGLRFFTVYGPWTRPDMALFKFTQRIFDSMPIDIYNRGNLQRDFTYIDDIVACIVKIVEQPHKAYENQSIPYRVYNLGSSEPKALMDFVSAIETAAGITAEKNYLPMQPGDMVSTYADVSAFTKDYNYSCDMPLDEGVKAFVDWYRGYYSHYID